MSINNNFIQSISGYCYYIDSDISLDELIDKIYLYDSETIEDLFNYLKKEYEPTILSILNKSQEYVESNRVLELSLRVLNKYDMHMSYLLISSYIAHNVKHNIHSSTTLIQTLKAVEKVLSLTAYNCFDFVFRNKLKPHQLQTFNTIKNRNKNIIIASTGSGKTLLALYYAEFLFFNNKVDKIVIVAERNVEIIKAEIRKHLSSNAIVKYEIYTYFNLKTLNTDKDYSRTLFVFDEIHQLKNNNTVKSTYIRNIKPQYFIGLTATLFDKPSDIVSLSKNLNINDIQKIMTSMNTYSLEEGYKIYRIEKSLKLSIKEKEEYDAIQDISFFRELHLQLGYLSELYGKNSEIYNIISNHKDSQIIIFCNYLEKTFNICNHLQYLGVKAKTITGKDNELGKNNIVNSFKSGDIQVLITTNVLKASYNLQNANVIIFCDYSYQVIGRIQSEGRVKRIGQDKEIYIYDIYYEDTVEQKITNVLNSKKEMLNEVQSKMIQESINKELGIDSDIVEDIDIS